ncbi:MAG: hypothetical protein NTY68_02630 [Candidatus Micrarchaeota archaeon]|nr:hypothetical protein [Candidatus Micrarchaeota archaeon]
MKVRYILDEYESRGKREDILGALSRKLGQKVLVKGDSMIEVNSYDEREVMDMLKEYKIGYERS